MCLPSTRMEGYGPAGYYRLATLVRMARDCKTIVLASGSELVQVWRPSLTNATGIGSWSCQLELKNEIYVSSIALSQDDKLVACGATLGKVRCRRHGCTVVVTYAELSFLLRRDHDARAVTLGLAFL